jgi:LPXTG-motif cell wall-anchored protein
MIRRVLFIAGLAFASLVFFAGPARADYGGCNATASVTNVSPGQQITVSGTGAEPNGAVSASIGSTQIGSGTASATGTYSFSATIPSTASGTVTVSVSCGDGGGVDALTITVASTSENGLARTGSSDAMPFTTMGIGLVTAGALVLVVARRRRHNKIAA